MKKTLLLREFLISKWNNILLLCSKILEKKRLLILSLSLAGPDILKQSKLTNDEIIITKNLALEKLHRQKCSKEYFSSQVLE